MFSSNPSPNTEYLHEQRGSLITAPVQINSRQFLEDSPCRIRLQCCSPSVYWLLTVLPHSLQRASKGKECHLPKRDRLLLQAGVTCAVSVQLAPS